MAGDDIPIFDDATVLLMDVPPKQPQTVVENVSKAFTMHMIRVVLEGLSFA